MEYVPINCKKWVAPNKWGEKIPAVWPSRIQFIDFSFLSKTPCLHLNNPFMEAPLAVIQWSISVIKVNFPLLSPLPSLMLLHNFPSAGFRSKGIPQTQWSYLEGLLLEINM